MANQTHDYGDLRVSLTAEYKKLWNEKGSGAARDVTFWQPKSQGGLRPLGSVGIGNYEEINAKRATLLVGANPNKLPSGGKSAVANPTGYYRLWDDLGSRVHDDCSIWRPKPPDGYISLGDVVASSRHEPPGLEEIWCLRDDLVMDAKYPESSFWDDKKLGTSPDISFWGVLPESIGVDGSEKIPILADTFRVDLSYSRPKAAIARVPALQIQNDFKKFIAKLPNITPDTLPTKGDQFDNIEQCTVTLPFIAFFPPTHVPSLDYIHNPFCSISRSIAWYTEGVWENNNRGGFDHSETITYGVSSEQTEEMKNEVGVEVSAKNGTELTSQYGISLNYQFTLTNSKSFTEYIDKQVVKSFHVPAHYATVLFSKHIWVKVMRAEGSKVLDRIEIAANDDVHLSGCDLPHDFEGGLKN